MTMHSTMVLRDFDAGETFYPKGGEPVVGNDGFGLTATEADSTFGTVSASSPARSFDLIELNFLRHDTASGTDYLMISVELYEIENAAWKRWMVLKSNADVLDVNFPLGLRIRPEHKVAGFRLKGVDIGSSNGDCHALLNYRML